MKRAAVISLLLMFFAFSAVGYGSPLDAWRVLPGYVVDGERYPTELELTEDGLQVTIEKGYYIVGGEHYSAIMLKEPVNVDDVTVEFRLDEAAGFGIDMWFGLHLLSEEEYFDVQNPGKSQGVVTLIRPQNPWMQAFQLFEHVTGFNLLTSETLDIEIGDAIEFQFRKTDMGHEYVVNGEPIGLFFFLEDSFPDGKAYLWFGASTDNEMPNQFTVVSVDGVPASEL